MDIRMIVLIYIGMMNLFGFIAMGIDKSRAVKNKWRIKERTLFIIALLGGSLGSIFGMQIFRHKTKHKRFLIGMPTILIVQIIFFILIVYKN